MIACPTTFPFGSPTELVGIPLTAEKYAGWFTSQGEDAVVNILLDYETFGEHQWTETGIFEFLKALPREILKNRTFDFPRPQRS